MNYENQHAIRDPKEDHSLAKVFLQNTQPSNALAIPESHHDRITSSFISEQERKNGDRARKTSNSNNIYGNHIPHKEKVTVLAQKWNPCTGDASIGKLLDSIHFPISYRDLVYRWIALGRPKLLSLQNLQGSQLLALGRQNNIFSDFLNEIISQGESSVDIQQICEKQEIAIIASIKEHTEHGHEGNLQSFNRFATHLDLYSALYTELSCLESGTVQNMATQKRIYEGVWRSTLQAFEVDRSNCTSLTSHFCLNQVLWGEIHVWSLEDIEKKCIAYSKQTSVNKSILPWKSSEQEVTFSDPFTLTPLASFRLNSNNFSENDAGLRTSQCTLKSTARILGVDPNISDFSSPLKEMNSDRSNNSSALGTPSLASLSSPECSPSIEESSLTPIMNASTIGSITYKNGLIDHTVSGVPKNIDFCEADDRPQVNKQITRKEYYFQKKQDSTSSNNIMPIIPHLASIKDFCDIEKISLLNQDNSEYLYEIQEPSSTDGKQEKPYSNNLGDSAKRRFSETSIESTSDFKDPFEIIKVYSPMLQYIASKLDTAAQSLYVQATKTKHEKRSQELQQTAMIAAKASVFAVKAALTTSTMVQDVHTVGKVPAKRPSLPRSPMTS